jgi:hypothetical protein
MQLIRAFKQLSEKKLIPRDALHGRNHQLIQILEAAREPRRRSDILDCLHQIVVIFHQPLQHNGSLRHIVEERAVNFRALLYKVRKELRDCDMITISTQSSTIRCEFRQPVQKMLVQFPNLREKKKKKKKKKNLFQIRRLLPR